MSVRASNAYSLHYEVNLVW